jgi:hypothetical protein
MHVGVVNTVLPAYDQLYVCMDSVHQVTHERHGFVSDHAPSVQFEWVSVHPARLDVHCAVTSVVFISAILHGAALACVALFC